MDETESELDVFSSCSPTWRQEFSTQGFYFLTFCPFFLSTYYLGTGNGDIFTWFGIGWFPGSYSSLFLSCVTSFIQMSSVFTDPQGEAAE